MFGYEYRTKEETFYKAQKIYIYDKKKGLNKPVTNWGFVFHKVKYFLSCSIELDEIRFTSHHRPEVLCLCLLPDLMAVRISPTGNTDF